MFNKQFEELQKDHIRYHSKYQRDHFITGKNGVTDYGQYKQSLRETFSRKKTLENMVLEREDLIEDIRLLKAEDFPSQRKFEIECVRKQVELENVESKLLAIADELAHFYSQATHLKQLLGEMSPEKKDSLDKQMWISVLQRNAAIEFIANGRVSKGTIETIFALPLDDRKALIEKIQNPELLISEGEKIVQLFEFKGKQLDASEILKQISNDVILRIGE